MIDDNNQDQRASINDRIMKSMEELKQLHRLATLDDFQNLRSKQLERWLNELRAEMQALDAA